MKGTLILKGGPGSGNKGHAGIKGHLGGSRPKGSGGGSGGSSTEDNPTPPALSFNKAEWDAMDVPTRLGKWSAMSERERDALANAGVSIKDRIAKVTSFVGNTPTLVGDDVKGAIRSRSSQLSTLVVSDASDKILDTLNNYDDALAAAGVSPAMRYKMTMDAADALYVQENECMGRSLGDHGIHHIQGNIDAAVAMMNEVPGTHTPEDLAKIYTSAVYHDMGYLTSPSHSFMDEGHPRWSQQYYDKNIRGMVEEALGDNDASDISHIIRTHDSTDINYEDDLVGSCVRIADNTALFQREKLPPLFRNVPGNADVLTSMAAKEISFDEGKKLLNDNVESTDLSAEIKSELHRAANEVSPITPKFTLGMLGGEIASYHWNVDHISVGMRPNKKTTVWQKMIDLGQKQFSKFAKSYNQDPDWFRKSLTFKFTNNAGRTLLEGLLEEDITKEFKRVLMHMGKRFGLSFKSRNWHQ